MFYSPLHISISVLKLNAEAESCLESGPDGADLAPDRFSGPKEPPEAGGGGQGVTAGKELFPVMKLRRGR